MFTVTETPMFIHYAANVWSEGEREEFVDFIAANPEVGDVIPVDIAVEADRRAGSPIIIGEAARQLGFELAPIGERNANFVRALNHVMIGDDDAGLFHDHARTERTLHAFHRHAL